MIILAKGYTTKLKWQFKKNARLIVVTNPNRAFGKLSCIFRQKLLNIGIYPNNTNKVQL